MAYDGRLAERVRAALGDRADVREQQMFGGIAFMVGGRMCAGVTGTDLMVRVGPEGHAAALARPHTRPMDFTGRPMTGFVFVAAGGVRTVRQVRTWVETALAYRATQGETTTRARRGGARPRTSPRRRD